MRTSRNPGTRFAQPGYRRSVAGKLGLVGAVAIVWLLTFVLMGKDVMPALSHDPPPARAHALARTPGQAALAAQQQVTDVQSRSGQILTVRPKALREPPPLLEFRISSFNMLGSSHTRHGARGRGPGSSRAAQAAHYVLANNIDIVGFQEMQGDQRSSFTNATGGRYGLYPGNALRGLDGENSIAYRLDTWEMVKPDTVSIPYFGGRPRNMPVILLKNKKSGVKAYFTNFHNPADIAKYGNQAKWRAVDRGREAALFRSLKETGIPFFVTGDMNEKQSWFCAVAGAGDLRAAAGGHARGGCSVAGGFRIDWIAGSYDVQFSNYREDKSGTIKRITDHAVMSSDVTVDGSDFPNSVDQ